MFIDIIRSNFIMGENLISHKGFDINEKDKNNLYNRSGVS